MLTCTADNEGHQHVRQPRLRRARPKRAPHEPTHAWPYRIAPAPFCRLSSPTVPSTSEAGLVATRAWTPCCCERAGGSGQSKRLRLCGHACMHGRGARRAALRARGGPYSLELRIRSFSSAVCRSMLGAAFRKASITALESCPAAWLVAGRPARRPGPCGHRPWRLMASIFSARACRAVLPTRPPVCVHTRQRCEA